MAIRTAYGLLKDYPEQIVETVKIPAGATFKVGDVISTDGLVSGSNKVYVGKVVEDITADEVLLIIDQKFVELADGRRISGSNLLTDLSFTEGMVITAIRMDKHIKFEISQDALENTGVVAPAAGVYLVGVNDSQQLATIAALLGTETSALVIEAVTTIPTGGQMSLGYGSGVIARVILG